MKLSGVPPQGCKCLMVLVGKGIFGNVYFYQGITIMVNFLSKCTITVKPNEA